VETSKCIRAEQTVPMIKTDADPLTGGRYFCL